nr:MAG TPA: hypothetical protein [Caudoviricetes sp.]
MSYNMIMMGVGCMGRMKVVVCYNLQHISKSHV